MPENSRRRRYQRKRKTLAKEQRKHEAPCCIDRISNLPVHIIHQILSLVPPKDGAKTSVLSRLWRSIWASHPDIYLIEGDSVKRDAFLAYMKKLLDKCENKTEFDKLMLCATVDDSSSELLVKKWIDFALKDKVKWLHLSILRSNSRRFTLCDTSFSSTTLTALYIDDCGITNCSFMLPNLKGLVLYDVLIENHDFKELIVGCPQLQVLWIMRCRRVSTIVVSTPALRSFIVFPNNDDKIQIESPNLESLEFISFSSRCKVDITSMKTVKYLTLRVYSCRESELRDFINRFPLLEELTIDGYGQFLNNFCISHQHLKSIVLKLHGGEKGIISRLDAPKLKSLEYFGGLKSLLGIRVSQQLEYVKVHLEPPKLDTQWYTMLRQLLKSFAHSKHLTLICQNEKAVIFPDELTATLLPTINDLKNLELQIDSSTATSKQILDGFIWILPGLESLSLTLGSISRLIKFPQRQRCRDTFSLQATENTGA